MATDADGHVVREWVRGRGAGKPSLAGTYSVKVGEEALYDEVCLLYSDGQLLATMRNQTVAWAPKPKSERARRVYEMAQWEVSRLHTTTRR